MGGDIKNISQASQMEVTRINWNSASYLVWWRWHGVFSCHPRFICLLAVIVTHGTSEKRFIWLNLQGHKQNLKAGLTVTLHSIVSRQGAHSQPRTYNRNHPETTACWLAPRLMLRLVPYEVCCPDTLLPQWAEPSCID